jgi:predicted Fe-Mo cluster-binding NifX family protein
MPGHDGTGPQGQGPRTGGGFGRCRPRGAGRTADRRNPGAARENTPLRRIAIAAEDGRGLRGEVSAHFGRCPYYVRVEVVGDSIARAEVIANAHHGQHQPGVMPLYIHGLGVDVIIAGGMGPRAVQIFQAMGIEVATGAAGVVGKVLEAYLRGEVRGIVPCAHDHPESCGGHEGGQHG